MRRRLAAGLAIAGLVGVAGAAHAAQQRLGGSVAVLYRRDSGTMLGLPFRTAYLDTRVDLGTGGTLVGPRLGNYQLTGGLDLLRNSGRNATRNDTRSRLGGRVNLLPLSPLTLTSFYDGGWSNATPATLQYDRSDAWGGGAGARLGHWSTTSADFEKREDHYASALNSARTVRAHHGSSIQRGRHALNLNYDFTDRRLASGLAGLDYGTRRNTARFDTHLGLGVMGDLGSWLQFDQERSRTLTGSLLDHTLENRAANVELSTPLGKRSSVRHSFADQTYRYSTPGQPTSLRFQIAEQRLESRHAAGPALDLHGLVRTQFSRVERQPDLWLVTAVADLEHPHPGFVTVIPRAGVNVYSGGIADGTHLGENLGLTVRLRGEAASLELGVGRDRTKSTGLGRRMDGGSVSGFSPRQAGAQLVHAARAALSGGAGRLAYGADYEFQRIENASLGLDYGTHRVHGSTSYRVSDRLSLDAGGDYTTTDNNGVYFSSDYRSVSGTLAASARPSAALELRARGTYGRAPAGPRESYWLSENSMIYRFPELELALLYRAETRTPEGALAGLNRSERLLELRATRRFFSAF
jgi:hypothetical protein